MFAANSQGDVGHRQKRGIVLTLEQVIEIYEIKLALNIRNAEIENMQIAKSKGTSVPVAKHYNVSPKAIRDIWNHITWKHVTYRFWPKQIAVSKDDPIKSVLVDLNHQV